MIKENKKTEQFIKWCIASKKLLQITKNKKKKTSEKEAHLRSL